MGSPNAEQGLHQLSADATSRAVKLPDGFIRDCSKGASQTFTVDPNFLSYTALPITITAEVRRSLPVKTPGSISSMNRRRAGRPPRAGSRFRRKHGGTPRHGRSPTPSSSASGALTSHSTPTALNSASIRSAASRCPRFRPGRPARRFVDRFFPDCGAFAAYTWLKELIHAQTPSRSWRARAYQWPNF